MSIYHVDYETSSACDITLGSYRYASDPSTRILMFAISKDDDAPMLWRFDQEDSVESVAAARLFQDAIQSCSPIYAHNAQFELAISTYRLAADVGIEPPGINQWRCTKAMCVRAAAPESLAEAAKFFGLDAQKDAIGKSLIGIFSDQSKQTLLREGKDSRKTNSPILETPISWDATMTVSGSQLSVREAWTKFCEYCRQDVRVEQQLHKLLEHFELKGDVLESFLFDMRMNSRGVPVNVSALHHADAIVEQYKEKLETRFRDLCGLGAGQREKLLGWLKDRGYKPDDLTAGSVSLVLASKDHGMTDEAYEVLSLRSLLSFSALKKIPTMRDAACADGRVRGTTQWHAARTGRSGGRIIQPQNFKKSTIKDSELCYRLICEGYELEWFEELWASPLEAIASSIRHFIQPHGGRKILDADYVGVEARITPWLAGDTAKLQLILDGTDLYKLMATRLFNVGYDEVTKEQRTISKPVELGCCFGVGGKSLREALGNPPYNVERTRKECDGYVKIYRENHTETVQAWRDIEDAAKYAVKLPGKKFGACNGKLQFSCGRAAGITYLTMRLPSGRRLYYPHPQVKQTFKKYDAEDMEADPWKKEKGGYWIDQISFHGKRQETVHWGRVGTWGSRLFENAVQATGADLLNYGMICAEKAGYEIFMPVHDQALAEDNGLTLEGYLKALCQKQPWAEDFPLAADGAIQPFYLKD